MSRLVIDCGEYFSDMFPDNKVTTFSLNGMIVNRDSVPTVRSKINYQGETYEVITVEVNDPFFKPSSSNGKKPSKKTKKKAINPYVLVNVTARKIKTE